MRKSDIYSKYERSSVFMGGLIKRINEETELSKYQVVRKWYGKRYRIGTEPRLPGAADCEPEMPLIRVEERI